MCVVLIDVVANDVLKHCIVCRLKASQADFRVRLGSDSPFDGGQLFTVSKLFVHPKYQGSWDWDLALLKLNASIKFGESAKPIKIARSAPKTGRKGTVTGWGNTSASVSAQQIYSL